MTPLKELYVSPDGDRWTLGRNSAGSLAVSHYPSRASGGQPSETVITDFLSGASGPEQQALLGALTDLGMHAGHENAPPPEPATRPRGHLWHALGRAVAQCWGELPQDVQRHLFEAAVNSEGEIIRQELAIFLHDRHERTRSLNA